MTERAHVVGVASALAEQCGAPISDVVLRARLNAWIKANPGSWEILRGMDLLVLINELKRVAGLPFDERVVNGQPGTD